jgi:serine/threonine-protein kinase haspin
LTECAQTTPHEFSAFIESFPFDPIVQPIDEDFSSPTDVQFRKIGEASYSEVFGIGNVVLKVIPLRDDTSASAPTPISEPETPFPSEAKDVLKEIIVTRAMGEMCDGFVKLLRTYIVRGKYPELLLALWDEYDKKKGSEGVRPGKLDFEFRSSHVIYG